MEFPPIEDARWDRLLRVVLAAEARDPAREGPLATDFPTPALEPAETLARATRDLDAYV